MRIFVFTLLFVLLSIPFSFSLAQVPLAPEPPAKPISPEDGAKGITLNANLALVLEWRGALNAQEYRYQYWKLGDVIPGPDKEEKIGTPKSNPIAASTLEPKAQYFWHVRSCADILEETPGIDPKTECGEYSEPWSFTFLLLPPEIAAPTSGGTNLPVRFDWDEVVGAESYLIRGEIDFSKGFLGSLGEFLKNPTGWFIDLGVNFLLDQLGVDKEAIACPYALWDEETQDCISLGIGKDQQGLLPSEYQDSDCLFTKETKYKWEITACLGENETFCGPMSSKKSFETSDVYNGVPGFVIPAPQLKEPLYDPANPGIIPIVGFSDVLGWEGHLCGHFSKVTAVRESDGTKIEALEIGGLVLESEAIRKVWDALGSVYQWKVRPCFIGNDQQIRCEATVSDTWKFKTTGASPLNLKTSVAGRVEISWDAVPKAGSYHYQVATSDTFPQGSVKKEGVRSSFNITLQHPEIAPASPYWWRVRTCVDPKGEICGAWSQVKTFTTLPVKAPAAPEQPEDKGEMFLPGILSWKPDPGANYYTYQVQYTSLVYGKDEDGNELQETLEGCDKKAGSWLIPPKKVGKPPITSQPNLYLSEQCLGQYRWQVASCLDKDCAVAQPPNVDNAPVWTFTAVEQAASGQGLVPCGRTANDPSTPYNEREPCQLKHAGFLLQNLLDFILWKVSLLVLLILAVMSGAISYFSLGTPGTAGGKPDTAKKVRAMFRSFFVGFLILMFAWMFVNIVLVLFGFQFEFFGRWWELPF